MAVANQFGIDLQGIQQGWENTSQNALRSMLLNKQAGQIDRDIGKQNALAQWLNPALGGDKTALANVAAADPEMGMKVANYLKPAAAAAPTNLEKLIAARDKLPEGDPRRSYFDGAIAKETRAEADPLVEIYDQNSPTQTRMVPRSQAANQPGKPASGLTFASDGKGGFTLVQGRGGPSNSFGQSATNKVDEDIIGNSNRMARVYEIGRAYNPEFLTFEGQVSNWGADMLEKINPALVGPETKAKLAAYTDFRAKAYNDLNQTLKEMSGAAITPQEADRLLKVLGDPTNDGPTKFKSKLDNIIRDVRMSQARLLYLRQSGPEGAKKIDDIGLSDMPRVIRDREAALISQAKTANPNITDDQLKGAVRDGLRKEFGL